MGTYIDLLLVALVTIYIVDISGFTESWRSALQKALKISSMRSLKPFDCGKCMTWWVCLIYALCTRHLCLETIAFSAFLSLMSNPIGETMIFIREVAILCINKIMP